MTAGLTKSYPHIFKREIYLYETDALGHLNNVSFIAYMEGARFELFKEMGIFDPKDLSSLGLILARIECDYLKEVRYGDSLLICTRVKEIGRSSFTLDHLFLREGDGEVVARGRAVLVSFDYENNHPRRLDPELRQNLKRYQGEG
ncbi:MAG TPA: acyl-CoA thioesterase [Deltaproteobacteria bacterium]|nr:acyl-CoA thioesterase [Deltaproteobacteria bacterium]